MSHIKSKRIGTTGFSKIRLLAIMSTLFIFISYTSYTALASGSEDALAYVDPAVPEAQARVSRAQERLTFEDQLSYSATLLPSVNFGDNLEDEEPASFGGSLRSKFALNYRYNSVTEIQQLGDLLDAERDLEALRRDGIEEALQAYGNLLLAQLELPEAQVNLAATERELAAAEAQFAAGELSATGLSSRRLQLERVQLDLRRAARSLREAQERALRYGLEGEATYRPLRFALPEGPVVIAELDDYRERALNVELAKAQLFEASVLGPLENVQLGTSYANESVSVGTAVGIFDNVPGASLNLNTPGSSTDRWQVSLSAEIVLGSSLEVVSDRERQLKEAQEALEAFVNDYKDRLEVAGENLAFAEASLTFAERALDLDRQQFEELKAELESLRASLETADEAARAEIERSIQNTIRELEGTERSLVRSESALYRSWIGYVRDVARYLELVDGSWAIR